jgi:hypothetical protein
LHQSWCHSSFNGLRLQSERVDHRSGHLSKGYRPFGERISSCKAQLGSDLTRPNIRFVRSDLTDTDSTTRRNGGRRVSDRCRAVEQSWSGRCHRSPTIHCLRSTVREFFGYSGPSNAACRMECMVDPETAPLSVSDFLSAFKPRVFRRSLCRLSGRRTLSQSFIVVFRYHKSDGNEVGSERFPVARVARRV